MNCNQTLKRLSAYIDQELDASDLMAVADHLDVCVECRREYVRLDSLGALIKTKAPYHDAPAQLAARIVDALPKEQRPAANTKRWNWLSTGAVFASLLAVAWSLNLYLALPAPRQQLAEAVLASHVRSLQANHLSDVASSDQHTVKPWFNGKLDFSPPVVDHTTEGFPLMGGRLDYLDKHAVAALVYRHRLHTINLFIWPGVGTGAMPRSLTLRGYHLVGWETHGMHFWAVSDLSLKELEAFSRLVQATS
jgi:anti-sigma factor (TIGR02949 family)